MLDIHRLISDEGLESGGAEAPPAPPVPAPMATHV